MIVVQGSMPEHCSLCWMFDTRKHDCSVCCHPPVDPNGKRPHWCPIRCELPDDHGDLIDKAALQSKFNRVAAASQDGYIRVDTVAAMIGCSLVLVPAETW